MADSSVQPERLRTSVVIACILSAAANLCRATAEDPPPAKPPRIAMLAPSGAPVGQTTRLTLRGWTLKDATAVTCDRQDVQISIVSNAAAPVPGKQKADQIGNEQLEVDVTVPAGTPVGTTQVTVQSKSGQSSPHRLYLGSELPLLLETEPNDGFRQAQQISVPQTISGSIHADGNVDVFAFELTLPTRLQISVEAAALGSGLDPMLTLLTQDGAILLSNDDSHEGRDARITTELPAGKFLIVLQDAHDRGGPAHPYRISIQPDPKPSS
ncbi:MAG: DVUA0089 family protein [Planctomycetaceae bacterium]